MHRWERSGCEWCGQIAGGYSGGMQSTASVVLAVPRRASAPVSATIPLWTAIPTCSEIIAHVQVGALWLREWCEQTAGGNSGGVQSDDSVALAVARILMTKGADQAATVLFELFGEEAIEQIQKLLERR